MSDFTTKPAADAKDADQSSSDEGGSSRQSGRSPSFWVRAARILRPQQGSRLREDLADALMTTGSDDDDFSPDERAMLHNILRFREVRVADVMVPRADIEAVDQNITIGELMILFEESACRFTPIRSMIRAAWSIFATFFPMLPSRRATSAEARRRQLRPSS
jgi:Mg2+/Co2+ transporter CorC